MREYFIPPNEPLRLMDEKRALTQEFGKPKYRNLTLQIANLYDFDRLHRLQPLVRKEVEKIEPANLKEAIQIAEHVGNWAAAQHKQDALEKEAFQDQAPKEDTNHRASQVKARHESLKKGRQRGQIIESGSNKVCLTNAKCEDGRKASKKLRE